MSAPLLYSAQHISLAPYISLYDRRAHVPMSFPIALAAAREASSSSAPLRCQSSHRICRANVPSLSTRTYTKPTCKCIPSATAHTQSPTPKVHGRSYRANRFAIPAIHTSCIALHVCVYKGTYSEVLGLLFDLRLHEVAELLQNVLKVPVNLLVVQLALVRLRQQRVITDNTRHHIVIVDICLGLIQPPALFFKRAY